MATHALPPSHLAFNIYEPSNANKVSIDLDFSPHAVFIRPLAILVLIPRLSYQRAKYRVGKMTPKQSQCCGSVGRQLLRARSAAAACELLLSFYLGFLPDFFFKFLP